VVAIVGSLLVAPGPGALAATKQSSPKPVVTDVACSAASCVDDAYQAVAVGSSLYIVRRSDGAVLRVDANATKPKQVGSVGATPPCAPTDLNCTSSRNGPFVGLAVLDRTVWVLAPQPDGSERLFRFGAGAKAAITVPAPEGSSKTLAGAGGRLWTVITQPPLARQDYPNNTYKYLGELASAAPGAAFQPTGTPASGLLDGAGSLLGCECGGFFYGGPGFSVQFSSLLIVDAKTNKVLLEDRGDGIAAAAGLTERPLLMGATSYVSDGRAIYGIASFSSPAAPTGLSNFKVFFRVDDAAHKVTAVRAPDTDSPQQLAAADGRLWAVLGSKVARIDPATLTATGCLPSISGVASAAHSPILAAGGGLVWTIDPSGRVARVPASARTQSCAAATTTGPKAPGLLRAADLAGAYRQATPNTITLSPGDVLTVLMDPAACTETNAPIARVLRAVDIVFTPAGSKVSVSEVVSSFVDATTAKSAFDKLAKDETARIKCGTVKFVPPGQTVPTQTTRYQRIKLPAIGAGAFGDQGIYTSVTQASVTFVSGAYLVQLVFPVDSALGVKTIGAIAVRAQRRLNNG
jgi:hypothetical protein